MKIPPDVRCIICLDVFCCAVCRRAHEVRAHNLNYECGLCRYQDITCPTNMKENIPLLKHLVKHHLPLICNTCGCIFEKMEDFYHHTSCSIAKSLNDDNNNDSLIKDSSTSENILFEKEMEIEKDSFPEAIKKLDEFDSEEKEYFEGEIEVKSMEVITADSGNSTNDSRFVSVQTPASNTYSLGDSRESSCASSEEESYECTNKAKLTPYPRSVYAKSVGVLRTATPHPKKVFKRQLGQYISTDLSDKEDKEESPEKEEQEKCDKFVELPTPSQEFTPTNLGNFLSPQESQEDLPLKASLVKTPEVIERGLQQALRKLTTSTPTHSTADIRWPLFPNAATESPLSEIDNTGGDTADPTDPASTCEKESTNPEGEVSNHVPRTSESSNVMKLLKSIMSNSSQKHETQDSVGKQVKFADSVTNEGLSEMSSMKASKKVTFAHDTKFETLRTQTRVFRRPKRLLTPGRPKHTKYIQTPRFQAMINRFEYAGGNENQTPTAKPVLDEMTPELTELISNPARAIKFKENESPSLVNYNLVSKTENQLSIPNMSKKVLAESENFITPYSSPDVDSAMYKTCISDTPVFVDQRQRALEAALSVFSSNVAGTIQRSLSSAIQTTDGSTEIHFKFVVTNKKVTMCRQMQPEDSQEDTSEKCEKENVANAANSQQSATTGIWGSLSRAMKNVIWGNKNDSSSSSEDATTTPVNSRKGEKSPGSSGKRKIEATSDFEASPLNHKKMKYGGRIKGRRPLSRMLNPGGVFYLEKSYSTGDHGLVNKAVNVPSPLSENLNVSF